MKYVILCLTLLLPTFAFGIEPSEILDDPVLEQRAREISKDIRCLVCKSENIDESNASLAKDLRLIVRERLVQGDTNEEVKTFIVDRYGEFALLNPTTGGANAILWWSGPMMMLLALVLGLFYVRSRSRQSVQAQDGLSDEEQKRLDELLKD